MKIGENLAGAASVKFTSRVMKLVFVIAATGATTNDVLAALRTSTVEVTSTHPSYATKTRLYEQSLLKLAEIAVCNEGSIRITGASGAYTVRFDVELSDDGAIVPLENEQFSLKLNLAAGLTAKVNALDATQDAVTEFEYKPVPCFGGTPTPVNVMSSKWLAIPKDVFTRLELEYPSGQKIAHDADELDAMVCTGNEQSLIINGAVTPGSLDLWILNVSAVKIAHVTTSAQGNVILVNEVLIY